MANQLVKLNREAIMARFTCSICHNLFRDATTISECLHTFCRKCIYKKLADEELDTCPKCDINLGCAPVEKLRPDHNLQDVRAKIFPLKKRKVNAPEVTVSSSLPVRRKERSLSSLVVSTPRLSTQSTMTRRRTKSIARKAVALRESDFSIDQSIKKEIPTTPESSSSHETLSKLAHHKRQTTGTVYINQSSIKHEDNDTESLTGNEDMWKPLTCLVEAANRTKRKYHAQGSDAKPDIPHATNNGARGTKGKILKQKRHHDDDDDSTSIGLPKSKKLKMRRNRRSASNELGASAQAILNSSGFKRDRNSPVWFKLVASEDQEGNKSLQQVPSNYLRIKDGDIPISFVQKYIVKKLDLSSEAEVEITCREQIVNPTMHLCDLLELWLQSTSRSERVVATVGSSAKDFVMVLAYRRRFSLQ